MSVDFGDAHKRHIDDAERLWDAARYPNADHLFGLAAECGLKALMLQLGMKPDSRGVPPAKDRLHINQLTSRYLSYMRGPQARNKCYQLPWNATTDPFVDWDVSQRYEQSSSFQPSVVGKHRDGARRVAGMVRAGAQQGGHP